MIEPTDISRIGKSNRFVNKIKKAIRIVRKEGVAPFIKELWLVATRSWRLRREENIWITLIGEYEKTPPMVIVHKQKMFLSVDDRGISKELACYQSHEPLSTQVLRTMLSPGETVIDIGANIGYYALLESQLVGSEGEVIAIEPSPSNVSLLTLNMKVNKIQNLRIINVAIGDYDGEGKLYLSNACNWNSLICQRELNQTSSVTVKVRSIDSLLKEINIRPSLIRMDIEGYETNAIAGMINTLNNYAPRLMIELHPQLIGGKAIRELIELLKSVNYKTCCAISKERDFPWNAPITAIESPTIEALQNDKRIIEENRGFMVFFESDSMA